MKVRIVRSFADAKHGRYQEGAVVDLPGGADWIEAGHAGPVEESSGQEVDLEQYHTGSGWYDVPGAEKKLREEDAIAFLQDEEAE